MTDLKKFAAKTFVVKVGGTAVGNEVVLHALIDDIAAILEHNIRLVLVHGGGTALNDELAAMGKQTKKINGLRVTDLETLHAAVKVFSDINERIAEKFRKKGVHSIGLCSKKENPFLAKQMITLDAAGNKVDLGWVGEIVDVDIKRLENLLNATQLPIVPPLGVDANGHYYNLNADHAALALAIQMQADGLMFLTDVPGVLLNLADSSSKIGILSPISAHSLIKQGAISGGMLPKLQSCINGIDQGIGQIAIVSCFEPRALINSLLVPQQVGTLITGENYES